jgi:IS30 family transposase
LYWTKKETKEKLSKDTIHKYIYEKHPEIVKKYFRRKWKKYKFSKLDKYQLNDRKMIDNRPKIVENRERIWDWEWDTIIWKRWWK